MHLPKNLPKHTSTSDRDDLLAGDGDGGRRGGSRPTLRSRVIAPRSAPTICWTCAAGRRRTAPATAANMTGASRPQTLAGTWPKVRFLGSESAPMSSRTRSHEVLFRLLLICGSLWSASSSSRSRPHRRCGAEKAASPTGTTSSSSSACSPDYTKARATTTPPWVSPARPNYSVEGFHYDAKGFGHAGPGGVALAEAADPRGRWVVHGWETRSPTTRPFRRSCRSWTGRRTITPAWRPTARQRSARGGRCRPGQARGDRPSFGADNLPANWEMSRVWGVEKPYLNLGTRRQAHPCGNVPVPPSPDPATTLEHLAAPVRPLDAGRSHPAPLRLAYEWSVDHVRRAGRARGRDALLPAVRADGEARRADHRRDGIRSLSLDDPPYMKETERR